MKEEKKLPEKFFKYIKKKGFLTGSKVLGGCSKNSDVDLVLKKDAYIMEHSDFFTYKKMEEQEEQKYENNCHEVAYITDSNGIVYNLLLFENQTSIDIWKKTTNTILQMKKDYGIIDKLCKNRETRVALFKLIRTCLDQYWDELKDEEY